MLIGRLDKAGFYLVFGSGEVTLINKNNIPFMQGREVGTMYEMDMVPVMGPITIKLDTAVPRDTDQAITAKNIVTAYATRSHTKATDIDTWHRHLGHIGYQVIE